VVSLGWFFDGFFAHGDGFCSTATDSFDGVRLIVFGRRPGPALRGTAVVYRRSSLRPRGLFNGWHSVCTGEKASSSDANSGRHHAAAVRAIRGDRFLSFTRSLRQGDRSRGAGDCRAGRFCKVRRLLRLAAFLCGTGHSGPIPYVGSIRGVSSPEDR